MANSFLLGFQALFRAWTDADFARRLAPLLEEGGGATAKESASSATPSAPGTAPTPPVPEPVAAPSPKPTPPRSDALALLAVLQREGRFLDFLRESVDGYSDADIGAAVRGLHKECGAVIERVFGVQPLLPQAEGAAVEVPAGHDPAQYHLVGPGAGASSSTTGAARGTLAHPGWRATRAELPAWTGRPESALVLAPAEVEVK